jgi:hypothetical protein
MTSPFGVVTSGTGNGPKERWLVTPTFGTVAPRDIPSTSNDPWGESQTCDLLVWQLLPLPYPS